MLPHGAQNASAATASTDTVPETSSHRPGFGRRPRQQPGRPTRTSARRYVDDIPSDCNCCKAGMAPSLDPRTFGTRAKPNILDTCKYLLTQTVHDYHSRPGLPHTRTFQQLTPAATGTPPGPRGSAALGAAEPPELLSAIRDTTADPRQLLPDRRRCDTVLTAHLRQMVSPSPPPGPDIRCLAKLSVPRIRRRTLRRLDSSATGDRPALDRHPGCGTGRQRADNGRLRLPSP